MPEIISEVLITLMKTKLVASKKAVSFEEINNTVGHTFFKYVSYTREQIY